MSWCTVPQRVSLAKLLLAFRSPRMTTRLIESFRQFALLSVLLCTLSVTDVHAQSAAVSSRLQLPDQERAPPPPAQQPRRNSLGLRIGGAAVLLASYATTAGLSIGFLLGGGLGAVAAGDDTNDGKAHCKTCSDSGLMLIPIAGPWIALANGEPIGPVPAVLLGIGQLVGAALLVVGWAPWADRGDNLSRRKPEQRLQLYAAPWHDGAAIGLRLDL